MTGMSFLPKKRVLVPCDFSDASLDAVRQARDMVADETGLWVAYVAPDLHPADPTEIWDSGEERLKRARESLVDKVAELGVGNVNIVVKCGDAGHELASLAEENDIELVVIPSHGRRGLKRILLGSVTERVLRLSPCPVLVLKRRS